MNVQFTPNPDARGLGRALRERAMAALTPEQTLELNLREVRALLALMPDRGWSDFVRRWRRRTR